MSRKVKMSNPTKMTSVPIRLLAKVPRRFMVLCSWDGGVALPLTDELYEEVDLRLAQHALLVHDRAAPWSGRPVGRVVAGDRSPVGHDRPVVLEPGEAVFDAPVVIVLVEEAETILVVEGRSRATLTESAMAARAVLVVELSALGVGVHGVDDEVLMGGGLVEAEPVAVVAHDTADLVNPQLPGRGPADPIVGRRVQERGERSRLLHGHRFCGRLTGCCVGRVGEGRESIRAVRRIAL